MNNRSEWDPLADFLSNMIAKYSEVLDIDRMPNPRMDAQETNTQNEGTGNVANHIVKDKVA